MTQKFINDVIQLSIIIDDENSTKLEIGLYDDVDDILNKLATKFSIDKYTLQKLKENVKKQVEATIEEKEKKEKEKKKRLESAVNRLHYTAVEKDKIKNDRINHLANKKEELEMKECTFAPKINENSNRIKNFSRFSYYNANERLFNNFKTANEAAVMNRIAHEVATRDQGKETNRSKQENSVYSAFKNPREIQEKKIAKPRRSAVVANNEPRISLMGQKNISSTEVKGNNKFAEEVDPRKMKLQKRATSNLRNKFTLDNKDITNSSIDNSHRIINFKNIKERKEEYVGTDEEKSEDETKNLIVKLAGKDSKTIHDRLYNDAKVKKERLKRYEEVISKENKFMPVINEESNKIASSRKNTKLDIYTRLTYEKMMKKVMLTENYGTEQGTKLTTEPLRTKSTYRQKSANRQRSYDRMKIREVKAQKELLFPNKSVILEENEIKEYTNHKNQVHFQNFYSSCISDYFDLSVDNKEAILQGNKDLPIPVHILEKVIQPTLQTIDDKGETLNFETFYNTFVHFYNGLVQ